MAGRTKKTQLLMKAFKMVFLYECGFKQAPRGASEGRVKRQSSKKDVLTLILGICAGAFKAALNSNISTCMLKSA